MSLVSVLVTEAKMNHILVDVKHTEILYYRKIGKPEEIILIIILTFLWMLVCLIVNL